MVDCDTFEYNDIQSINYEDEDDFKLDIEELDKMTKSLRVDWEIRESALKKIAGICLGDHMKNNIFLKFFNNRFSKNLIIQFKEKRSIIIRETCRILSFCAKILGFYIEKAVLNILSNHNIFMIIESNENSICVEYTTLCIFNLLRYIKSEKIIDAIFDKKYSKSDFIRIFCAKCVILIMKEFHNFMITNKLNLFYEIFNKYLIDVCEEVKINIRKAYFAFKEKMPSEAGIYFNSLDKNLQNQILDEEKFSKKLIFYKTPNKKKTKINRINLIDNNQNNLAYSVSFKPNNKEINKTINNNYRNRNIMNKSGLGLLDNHYSSKKIKAQKYQLDRLNKRLVQLNIIAGNDEKKKKNPDNISDDKLKELQKLNLVKNDIFTRGEKNIDKSVLNNSYMLIEEKLLMYIYKLEKCTTSENKLVIFEYIYNEFESFLKGLDKISKLTLRKFVDIHINNLVDIEQKLVEQIIKNLMRMTYYMKNIFTNYNIESMVKILITHICSGTQQIIILSKELLNIIRENFDNEEIFKTLYDLIKEGDVDISDICYQYLYFIIPNCDCIFKDFSNFKKFFTLVCLSDNQNFKSIGNIIKLIYKTYKEYFTSAFEEEIKDNQDNLLIIMDKSKFRDARLFRERYNEIRQKELEEEIALKERKERLRSSIYDQDIDGPDLRNIPFEIANSLKIGDINQFIKYIEKNTSYIPEYLLLLTYHKFNGSIYTKNIINFTYALLSSKKCVEKLNNCVELITNQVIHLFLTNTNNSEVIKTIKDILNILPFKLDSSKFLKCISNYLNINTDVVLLQALLLCLKNYIKNYEHKNLEEHLPFFVDNLLSLFNHNLEEIRRHAVICTSEIYLILGHKFEKYLSKLPKNQQNWVQIFINK